jgi:triosephosphate isomerase
MARTPLIAGNWKMHKTTAEAADLVRALLAEPIPPGVEVAVCPPFAALGAVRSVLGGSTVRLGAQDMHWEAQGAFTGEISPVMLRDLGCHYVIVGHSERRQLFGETDESAARKTGAAFAHGLVPILCVGERLEERDAGQTEAVVIRQTVAGTQHVDGARASALVVAYEPVWAIGTGRSASGEEANRVITLIRRTLSDRFGEETAGHVRILYGGSVTPDNAGEFSAQPDIDGALVGGASLDAAKFRKIIEAAGSRRRGT